MTKSDISKEFWPEAVNWSVHILNRSPTFFCEKYDTRGGMKRKKTNSGSLKDIWMHCLYP